MSAKDFRVGVMVQQSKDNGCWVSTGTSENDVKILLNVVVKAQAQHGPSTMTFK